MDKCPKYKFVGTTMSRPSCEKPECPQPGKKRKATVAQTGKENEQEGGAEPPCSPATKVKQKAAGMRSMHTKAGLSQCTTPLTRWLRTTFLLVLFPGMSHGCLPLLPRLWAFWLFTQRTTHGSPHKLVLRTLVHALLAATKVLVSQAEGGRYAKQAGLHQHTTPLICILGLSIKTPGSKPCSWGLSR